MEENATQSWNASDTLGYRRQAYRERIPRSTWIVVSLLLGFASLCGIYLLKMLHEFLTQPLFDI